jgi:hypothetical protein
MDDDRIAPRIGVDAAIFVEVGVRIDPEDTGEIVICNSLDISEGGLQVVLDEGMSTGQIVRICLDISDREPIFAIAKVMWQKSNGTDFRHGLMLLDADDTDLNLWQSVVEELSSEPTAPR